MRAIYTTGLALLAAALVAGCNGGLAPAAPTPVSASPPAAAPATPTTAATPSAATATSAPPTTAAAPSIAPATPTTSAAPSIAPVAPTPPPAVAPIDDSAVMCGDASDAEPSLANVVERLGYALMPTLLPNGFAFAGVSASGNAITQIYQQGGSAGSPPRNLILAYPVEFSPDGASGPLGWERPEDAVSELRLGDQTAYIMSGGWSDASIIAGPGLSPDKAEWDYDKSLALFFACRADDGDEISLAIQALPGPVDWISEREIVDIAHALRRITP